MLSRIFRESENAELKRKRQIDTLKVFNDNVTELQEDVEYQVEFVSGGNNMAILVSLGPEFPLVKPVLKVIPPVSHPWVNEHSEVTRAPGLLNFTVHSDLGRVVQAIIREFERNPPPLASEVVAGPSQMKPMGTDVATDGRMSPSYGLPHYPVPHTCPSSISALSSYNKFVPLNSTSQPMRTQSVAFPELSKLTNEDLGKLNESEDRLDEFIAAMSQTQKMNATLDELMTKNEELARETLSKQATLEKLKQVVRKKLDTVAVLKNKFEQRSMEHQRLSEKYAPQNIKEALRLAALQSDEESEKIAEQFLQGEIDVDHFVTSFFEKKVLSYSRKTKEEKLGNQLKELQRAGY
ncbi:vacuolar protein sorting-associated protein 37A [Anabrus simplex]|uniref:vacuolar protein sorting-associated protein 37A n=1 Tax=Anabrus simplex TaxID=316456 RepID=UPI0035A3A52C